MTALLAALFAAGVAHAGKKKDEPEPSVDADAIAEAEAEAEACARDVPENYQIHTGFASGADASDAINDARNAARKEAIDALCSGKSATRCAVIRRHIEDWKTPFHNPVTGKACAHVGVSRLWIDDDQRAQLALATAVQELAGHIVAAAPSGKPVALRAPVWGESGCDAGPLGVVVTSAVRSALAEGSRPLAPIGTPGSSEVRLVARTAANRVYVEASVSPWGTKTAIPVPSIDVAADLFPGDDGGSCWLDSRMGLPGGQRDGISGLMVRIDPRFPDDDVCEGDRSAPDLHVNQPARVKVFSVDRMGTAYLIWPAPGQSDKVETSVSLGDMDYVRSPLGGEERLVAIAVPETERFAEVDAWTGFCKHPRPFEVSPWPEAAANAVGLAVKAYDDPACIQRGVSRGAKVVIPEVPVCPRRLGE